MKSLLESIFSTQFLFSIIRVTTPLLYATLGVGISDLAGSMNVAMEGIMLISAFSGVVVSALTGSCLLALCAGLVSSLILGGILGFFHLKLKNNLVIGSVAINLLATGLATLLLYVCTGDKGSSSSIKSLVFPTANIPLLKSIPILGEALSGHNILCYVAFLSVVLYHVLIYRTPIGMRIRAVGQNAASAASVGVNVNQTKMIAILISSAFGALGGLYLSMGYVSWYSTGMTAGRGFIAIAAATIGTSLPGGCLIGALLFGVINTVAIYCASIGLPSELVSALPYLITIIVVAVYSYHLQNRTKRLQRTKQAL